jgi:hypothetical protein
MTNRMVRKQIYIPRYQDARLKRLSLELGISKAQIIRRAIEHELRDKILKTLPGSDRALDQFIQFAQLPRLGDDAAEAYPWNRQELYQDREKRWLHDPE